MNPRNWIVLAGLLGAAGVMLGAYHAHGLEKTLVEQGLSADEVAQKLNQCEVAVRYQMYHALALLGLGLMAAHRRSVLLDLAGTMFGVGTLFFSGGLYLLVFSGPKLHWSVVPLGGLVLIIGWLALAMSGFALTHPISPEPDVEDD